MVAIKNKEKVLFRASGVGALMIGGNGWTDADQEKLNELEARKAGKAISEKTGKPLSFTTAMAQQHAALIEKKKAPFQLSETAKRFVEQVWLMRKYGFRKEVITKEMLKGQLCEQDSMALVSKVRKIKAFRSKNKQRFSNAYFDGCPDVVLNDFSLIEDIKTSWDIETYLKAQTPPELYKAQGQVYMDLTGCRKFHLHYCLVDTPNELLIREDKSLWHKLGGDESPVYQQASEQLYKNHFYSNIPAKLRVKTFEYEYDPEYIGELKFRAEAAIEYYHSLRLDMVQR